MKRMTMWKKMTVMILSVIMITGLLAGCGSSGSQDQTTGGNETKQEEVTASAGESSTGAAITGGGDQVLQLGQNMPTGDLGRITEVNDMKEYTEDDVEKIDRAIRAYTPSVSEGLLINKVQDGYYYLNLPDDVKKFYEAMYMVAQDPVSADYYISVDMGKTITDEDFKHHYYMAYQALCFDHPELFWLYNYSKTSIDAGTNDYQTIYFSILESYTSFEQDMKAFNDAADAFISQIDTGASDLDKARQIHDRLCELVTYDYEVLEKTDEEGYKDLAHSAYGVLVENSRGDKNTAVCDGYSLAYQYLLTQCDVEAVLIPGKAGVDQTSMGGHAWNVAKIDGKWYEIDCTWDDSMMELKDSVPPETDGYDYIMEALEDMTYSDHLNHYLYGVSTPTIQDYEPVEADYYITKDGKYKICLTGSSKHYRANEYDDMGGDSELALVAPEAVDTLY